MEWIITIVLIGTIIICWVLNLHPLVSPDNWQVYPDLVDMIDELGELINDN